MKIRLDIAPDPSTVKGYAEDAVRTMQKVYGIQMDHSLDSLAHVDRVLREWRDGGAPLEAVTKSLYALGSYAGEVLVRHAHGRWLEPPKESVRTNRRVVSVCETTGQPRVAADSARGQ